MTPTEGDATEFPYADFDRMNEAAPASFSSVQRTGEKEGESGEFCQVS